MFAELEIATCDANPSFKPVDAGGDGSSVQYWYVGYDSSLKVSFGQIASPF